MTTLAQKFFERFLDFSHCHLRQMGGKIQIFRTSSWKCKIIHTRLLIWDIFTYDTFSRSRHLFFWRPKSYTIHLLTCFIRRILWRLWSKNRTMQQMIKAVCLKSFSFLFWKHLHIFEIHSWRLNIIRLKLQGHCEHILKLDITH